jgi:hypothetical protein
LEKDSQISRIQVFKKRGRTHSFGSEAQIFMVKKRQGVFIHCKTNTAVSTIICHRKDETSATNKQDRVINSKCYI